MKRTLLTLLAWLACFAMPARPTVAATDPTPPPAPDTQRFLFVMDISGGMERLQAANETALYELISTGIYGQMRTGDSYGLWTFNKETYTGKFPMQVWDLRRPSQLGAIAAAFLNEQNYEKAADVKHLMERLTNVISAVSNVTIFIISDGSSGIRGTPFDQAIASAYKQKRRERNAAKKPFVTALIARDGRMVDHSVAVAGQPITLPPRPLPSMSAVKAALPPDRPAGILISRTSYDSTAGTNSSVPNQPAPNSPPRAETGSATGPVNAIAEPAGATSLVARTEGARPQESSAPPRRPPAMQIITKSNNVATASDPLTPKLVEANATTAAGPAQTSAASEGPRPSQPLSATTPAVAVQGDSSPAPATDESAIPKALHALVPAPITVAARELPAEPPVAVQAVGLPAPRDPSDSWMLAFGVVLLAMVLMLLIVVLRRLRPAPGSSLITQSMERR